MSTIVLGLLGHPDDDAATGWAAALAGPDDEIVVVAAFEALALEDVIGMTAPGVREEIETRAQGLAAAAVERLVGLGRRARGLAYEAGTVDALLDTADAEHARLVVLGAGRRTGARDYLLGSVAERVVRHASVAVLVAR